jgi:hypothetical protein
MPAAKVQRRIPAPVPVPVSEFVPPFTFKLLERRNDLFPRDRKLSLVTWPFEQTCAAS